MKILIISAYFPPYNAIGSVRLGKLAKFLVDQGHDVKVVSADDDVLEKNLILEIDQQNVYAVKWIDIHKIPRWILKRRIVKNKSESSERASKFISGAYDFFRSIFHWPDRHIGWYFPAKKVGRKLSGDWKPDLIYASAWPITSLLVARSLSKEFSIPWIAELRDLWLDNHYYKVPEWRRKIDGILESRLMKSSELLVTVSDPLAETLRAKFHRPTEVVLNGYDPVDFKNPGIGSSEELLIITYTGMIYPGRRDPTPLFKAINLLGEDAKKIKVRFYGRLLPGLKSLIDDHGVSEIVEMCDPVSYKESLAIQQASDVLLLLLWDCPEEKGVYTGKLFEYIGSQRPILSCGMESGVAATLIKEQRLGLVSNNPVVIAKQLNTWLADKSLPSGVLKVIPASNANFSREQQFQKLIPYFGKLTSKAVYRKKIIVVTKGLEVGGTERHLLRVMPKLAEDFEIKLVVLQSGGFLENEMRSKGVCVLSPPKFVPKKMCHLWFAINLAQEMCSNKSATVHFFLPEVYVIGGILGAILKHKDMIMSRRSLNLYQKRHPAIAKIEKILHGYMRVVLGNSNAVVRDLIDEGVPESKIRLTYNGISLEELKLEAPNCNSINCIDTITADFVVVVVANLIHYKGHRDLILAMAKASPQLSCSWKLLLVGRDDGMEKELRKLASDLGISEHVIFVGQIEDVQRVWRIATIGVLPSHQEGFSNSLIEAMSMGVPMIATDVGGNSEAIVDGVSGLVVPPGDIDALSMAILRLQRDSNLCNEMGSKAKARIEENFSLDKLLEIYRNIYINSIN